MMTSVEMTVDPTVLNLYHAFQAQGAALVYAVRCCDRVYLGLMPAVKCRTCEKHPKSREIRQEADLDNL